MTAARRWAPAGYSLVLTLVVLAPLAAPGYLLLRDAVSTPRSFLTDAALGLGGTAPRAVPQDAAIAVLTAVVDGGILVKALLAAGVFAAGLGAARLAVLLLPDAGLAGQFVAATVAVWNPYVAERLLQGHWSLLLGYGCLPWVAAAAIRSRWAALAFWIAVAGITPTGLILAAVVAVVSLGAPRRARAAAVAGIAALAAAPWLVAAVAGGSLGAATGGDQAAGLAPFAARAEPGLGTLGSLAGLGGIWNADAVPPSRTTLFALAATAVLLVIVGRGVPVLWRTAAARPLLLLAVAAVLLPAAMATGPGLAALAWVVEVVPGLAVLRDGQKWVALAMPAYAVAGAAAVCPFRRANERAPLDSAPKRPAVPAAVCCIALIAALPDLSWGVWGRVVNVHYPPGWAAVAAVPRPGDTMAVLPAGAVRRFDWAGPAPVLDPLPRWVRAEVLATGDVAVSGHTVHGEGGRARAVEDLLLAGADSAELRSAGVDWVAVESTTPGATGNSGRTLAGLPVAAEGGGLTLHRVDGADPVAVTGSRAAVLAGHLLWAAMLVGAALTLAAGALRRWRQSPG